MRILFCNYEYPPLGGGGGVINALVAEELAKHHDVHVLTSRAFELPPVSTENGVTVWRAPVMLRKEESAATLLSMLTFLPSGIRLGKRLVKSTPYDVINTHFVLPTGPVGHALARAAGIPNVLSLHGGDLYDPSKFTSPHRHFLLRVWVKKLLRSATIVVGQSTNTLSNMRTFFTPEIEGVRIPLGIVRPPAEVEPASRARFGFDERDVVFVTVGRLVARKGLPQLLSVVDAIRQEEPAVRLVLIGSGPEESMLRQQISDKGLEDHVKLAGKVTEQQKYEILKMSNAYVSTSQHEGFGLVFLEAMAVGLPIVCYDHGGQTDFLEDGSNGALVSLNETEVFRERCLELIRNRDLRSEIGKTNLRCVEDFFIDNCARKYESVFDEAIRRSREHSIA